MVRVPNVVNKNADEAEALLNMESLGMSRDRMVYSDQIPQGVVLYQEQAPGSVLPVNTVIVVEISMGRENDD
jgi:beta-lactam-binding protein with PASTA domain